jgi:hypothetical protein
MVPTNPSSATRSQGTALAGALILLLGSAVAFALIWNARGPLAFEIVRVEPIHADRGAARARQITVRLSNASSNAVNFIGDQNVQFRVGGRWQQPEICSRLSQDYVGAGRTREDVVLSVPSDAEACRFSLVYRVGIRPYCKAYFFLERHGVRRHFPQLSIWVLKQIAAHEGPQRATVELMLPTDI